MGISDGIMNMILALIEFCKTSQAYFPGGRMCSVEIKSKEDVALKTS